MLFCVLFVEFLEFLVWFDIMGCRVDILLFYYLRYKLIIIFYEEKVFVFFY